MRERHERVPAQSGISKRGRGLAGSTLRNACRRSRDDVNASKRVSKDRRSPLGTAARCCRFSNYEKRSISGARWSCRSQTRTSELYSPFSFSQSHLLLATGL
eukprot:2908593-Pleurochrysis_carterae.AAC.4